MCETRLRKDELTMVLRLAPIGVALLVALFGLMMVAQTSSAQEEANAAQAAASRASVTQDGVASKETAARASVIRRVGFNCIVPRFGTGQCGPQFLVENGASLRVFLNTSGGQGVDFRARDVGSGIAYGQKPLLYPGQTKFMWTNRTRSGQYVYVVAGTPNTSVRVQATGHYTVYR